MFFITAKNLKTNTENSSLRCFLSKWTVDNNIPHTSLNALSGLRDHGHVDLPKNAKHILMKPKKTEHIKNADFTYCHVGIKTKTISLFQKKYVWISTSTGSSIVKTQQQVYG